MSIEKIGLFTVLGLVNIAFALAWIRAAQRARARAGDLVPTAHRRPLAPTWGDVLIGMVTDFLDSLGIGSFAPTTALYKFRRYPADELIPGTLNIGHNISAIIETVVYVTIVVVDPVLLATTIGSAALGAWVGAGVVRGLPRRAIQLVMGAALLIAAVFFALSNLHWIPGGGEALGLAGFPLALAIGANFVFGALMSAGIGLYAPCMMTLSLLGVNPRAAFPIMMGACGLVQPVAGVRFLDSGRFAFGPTLGLALGGTVGSLVGVFVVKELPLQYLRWLVIVAVTYAAVSMLRSARASRADVAPLGDRREDVGKNASGETS